jgi:hypothetical protein
VELRKMERNKMKANWKLILISFLAILIFTTAGCVNNSTTNITTGDSNPVGDKPILNDIPLHSPDINRITADELEALINKGPVPVIVDTRSASTFAQGHIVGAINIPAYPPGVAVQMGLIGLPKDQLIVFYCD